MRMHVFKGTTALHKVCLAMMMFVACLFCAINVKAATTTVTYDANGGMFDGAVSTNTVTYDIQEQTVKYSHSGNFLNDGTKIANYANKLDLTEVVTIPNAYNLEVLINYSGTRDATDYAVVWAGAHPEFRPTHNVGLNGYYGPKLYGVLTHTDTFTISGDSVTFGFHSDDISDGDGFGYFATIKNKAVNIISGSEEKPQGTSDTMLFKCWNTAADGSGTDLTFEEAARLGGIVYAKYESAFANGTYRGIQWVISQDGDLFLGREGVASSFQYKASEHYRYWPWSSYNHRDLANKIEHVYLRGPIAGNGDMNGMFANCKNLKTVDFSLFDFTNVAGTGSMFNDCQNLEELILPEQTVETAILQWSDRMFKGCSELTEINLAFMNTKKVGNAKWDSLSDLLLGCKKIQTLDLRGFDTTNAGNFKSNMLAGMDNLTTLYLSSNTNLEGTGLNLINVTYKNGVVVTGSDGSTTALTSSQEDERTWTRVENEDGTPVNMGELITVTSEELMELSATDAGGKWVTNASVYSINYTADGATGSMPSAVAMTDMPYKLSANVFQKYSYVFDHWDDGNGHVYTDNATIPANTYNDGEVVTLTAVFVPRNTSVNIQNGEFDLTLYKGEKATFDNIPAGTAYQVYEETPEGWVLIEQSNTSGIIQPLETADARFNNKYQPGAATIQFSGSKTLDNNAASEGAFTFILKEDNVEIDRKSTMNGGFVQFDVIEYTDADIGTHNYTIEEVNPDNDKLIWDTHKENITVEVSKTGSQLSAEATYDSDGIVFKNYTKPGILKIKKETEGTTEANANDEFTFSVTLNNDKGMPIDNDVQWYKEAS